jgi:ribonuclease HII
VSDALAAFDRGFPQPLAGVDEVGRGPLAGPVVAAAVVLPVTGWPEGIRDSKALSAAARERLAAAIKACADVGLGVVEPQEIDRLNIHHATLFAMTRAVAALSALPMHVLVDGKFTPPLGLPATAVVKGDARSLCIAAASIVAKVARDRIMGVLAESHPGYGWASNKGYPSAEHRDALIRLGPTAHHRRSFRPVAEALERARFRPSEPEPA